MLIVVNNINNVYKIAYLEIMCKRFQAKILLDYTYYL